MSKTEDKHFLSNSKLELDHILSEIENDDRIIGEQTKKKADDVRRAKIVAANYFTKERIKEIHEKSIDTLKCNDFSEEEYVEIFSDISKIEEGHIRFLRERLSEIEQYELGENTERNYSKSWLYDFFQRGGVNND